MEFAYLVIIVLLISTLQVNADIEKYQPEIVQIETGYLNANITGGLGDINLNSVIISPESIIMLELFSIFNSTIEMKYRLESSLVSYDNSVYRTEDFKIFKNDSQAYSILSTDISFKTTLFLKLAVITGISSTIDLNIKYTIKVLETNNSINTGDISVQLMPLIYKINFTSTFFSQRQGLTYILLPDLLLNQSAVHNSAFHLNFTLDFYYDSSIIPTQNHITFKTGSSSSSINVKDIGRYSLSLKLTGIKSNILEIETYHDGGDINMNISSVILSGELIIYNPSKTNGYLIAAAMYISGIIIVQYTSKKMLYFARKEAYRL